MAVTTKSVRSTKAKTLCECCEEPISGDARLGCAGCSAQYHRACRLEAGRCVRDGCKRAAGLQPRAPREESVLDVDVGPYIWGALWAVPLAGGLSAIFRGAGAPMPMVFLALLVAIAFLLGTIRARYAA